VIVMVPPEAVPQLKVPLQQLQHSQLDGELNEKPRSARNHHGERDRRGSVVSRERPHWPLEFLGIRWGEGMWNDVRMRAPYYW